MKEYFKGHSLLWIVLMVAGNACTKTGVIVDEDGLPGTLLGMGNTENIVAVAQDNANFRKTDDTLYYTLGVNRSGISVEGTADVNLVVNTDTIQRLLTNGQLPNAKVMPREMYHLPEKISVATGERHTEFELAVDLAALSAEPNQTFAIAVELSDPSLFELNETRKISILTFNFAMLLSSPSFIDDFNSADYTLTYASLTDELTYEAIDPSIRYNDGSYAMRSPGNERTSITYSVAKLQKSIPEVNAISGFKLKLLTPDDNANNWFELEYLTVGETSFVPVSTAVTIVSFVPELGQNSWRHAYVQGALPAETTAFRITLRGPAEANWLPLFSHAELFYEGGYPFVTDDTISF